MILASASPRRADLLRAAGIAFDVGPVDVDERPHGRENPSEYVLRVATLKCDAARRQWPDRLVLAADTTVVVDDEIFGKPTGEADAARMLGRLSGRSHDVLTGLVLGSPRGQAREVSATTVTFSALSADDIAWYVRTGEPHGKAGAYAIQGLGSRFVTRIAGSYANVVGLPVDVVVRLVDSLGYRIPAASTVAVAQGGVRSYSGT